MNRERIIEGIFNYCTRRCELCPFTGQCSLYQSEREYERKHPDATSEDQVHDSFAETFRLLEAWCRREGIDFEQIRREAESEETRLITMSKSTTNAVKAATNGFRRLQRHRRSRRLAGLARIVSPARKRCKSSASASAVR